MMIDEDDYEDTLDEEEELDEGDEDELADLQKASIFVNMNFVGLYSLDWHETSNPSSVVKY